MAALNKLKPSQKYWEGTEQNITYTDDDKVAVYFTFKVTCYFTKKYRAGF
jgi:hypothetical protein